MFKPYDKPPLALKDQVDRLRTRGMLVSDTQKAEALLIRINYYRFVGYALPFRTRDGDRNRLETYKGGTKIEDVENLYNFDSKLRMLLMVYLEVIEIAFRTALCFEASTQLSDPFWYVNPSVFKNQSMHADFLAVCDEEIKRNEHDITIEHYAAKYGLAYPPCWVMAELLSWGAWSKAYKNLKFAKIQKAVAGRLNSRYEHLKSWMIVLKDLRNQCAHHTRIWNRQFPSSPKLTLQIETQITNDNSLYPLILIMKKILKPLGRDAGFEKNINALFQKYPKVDYLILGKNPDLPQRPL